MILRFLSDKPVSLLASAVNTSIATASPPCIEPERRFWEGR